MFNPEELGRLKDEAGKASTEELLRYLQALQNAEQGFEFSSHPQIYFETILVRLCHFQKIVPLKDLLQELGGTKGALAFRGPAQERSAGSAAEKAEPSPSPASAIAARFERRDGKAVPPSRVPVEPSPAAVTPPPPKGRDTEAALKDPPAFSSMSSRPESSRSSRSRSSPEARRNEA